MNDEIFESRLEQYSPEVYTSGQLKVIREAIEADLDKKVSFALPVM